MVMNIATKNRSVDGTGGAELMGLFVSEELLSRNARVTANLVDDISKGLHSAIESFKADIGLSEGNLESTAPMRSGYNVFDRMLAVRQKLLYTRFLWRVPRVVIRNWF